MTEKLKKIFPEAKDFLPLLGTDYVEFYVGNAKQAAHFYKTALGFQSLAYSGLETGVIDRTSYVVIQDKIRLMFTTPMPTENNEIFDHIKKHGDGNVELTEKIDSTIIGGAIIRIGDRQLDTSVSKAISELSLFNEI